jgi:membrane protein
MTRGLRDRLRESVTEPGQTLGRWARFVGFQFALWRLCARRLREHDVMGMSAALCYRTIFTLIPVIVLGLLVAKSLGTVEDSKRSLRKFLEASGFAQIAAVHEEPGSAVDGATPATAPVVEGDTGDEADAGQRRVINVADEIERIVASVEGKLTFSRIGPIGGALLIWTAVGLLSALERSLNRIFGAARSRSMARRLLLYWSALTLGPVTLTVASYLGQRAIDIFGRTPGASRLLVAVGWVGPIVVGVLVLATLYKLLPNTAVRWRSAIGGAAVATVLWVVAKWGFSLYVGGLVLKGNLYGVLGVLPLFLLWLYYSWLILLFGAELAHTAVNLDEMRRGEVAERTVLGPSDVLATAVVVGQAFEAGRGPVTLAEVADRLRLPAACVQTLLDRLVAAGLVCTSEEGTIDRYLPARPVDQIGVLDVLDLGDPRATPRADSGPEPDLAALVARVQSQVRSTVSGTKLGDILRPA